MRVILTRPEGASEGLAGRLAASGFEVVVRPLIAIRALEIEAEGAALLRDLSSFDLAVFVSRSAALHGLAAIGRHLAGQRGQGGWAAERQAERAMERQGGGGPSPGQHGQALPSELAVYAVGPGTAAALAGLGAHAVAPDVPGSEGLLALAELQEVKGKAALIVKGRGGREALQAGLAARGAKVACLECYERVLQPLSSDDLPAAQGAEALVLTSGDILQSFLSSAGLPPSRFTALVPSARVAALAARHPFKRVVNAGAASDDALLECLITLGRQVES